MFEDLQFGAKGLFFTTGENQKEILDEINDFGINSFYFYNPFIEYEINAAINFELCYLADRFIGLSRSSYSNLVSLKRAKLLDNDNSYIYIYIIMIIRY